MAQVTGIEWTDHTANLVWGCTQVHAGCDNCYAKVLSNRWGYDVWGNSPRRVIGSFWNDLDKYQKQAKNNNRIARVFVGSMMDIFEKPMPMVDYHGNKLEGATDDIRQRFFKNITDGMYPNLMFLMLTKRPSNINKYIPEVWKQTPPANVMFGTSPCDQATAETLLPQLLQVNGKRFLSLEPQLADVTLLKWLKTKQIHWVIQGGESGAGKRPFDTNWGRKIKAECATTGTPYFFKQVDKIQAIPLDLQVRQFPEDKLVRSAKTVVEVAAEIINIFCKKNLLSQLTI